MFFRVRLKLTGLLTLLFLLLYIVTSSLIYELTTQMTTTDIDSVLSATADPLEEQVLQSLDRGLFPSEFVTLTRLSSLYPKVSAVILRDSLGGVIADTSTRALAALPYRFSTQEAYATDTLAHRQTDPMRVLTMRLVNPYGTTLGYLQVALDMRPDVASLNRLLLALLWVAAAGLALAAVAGYLMSRYSLAPVVESWNRQQRFVADASHELRSPLTVMMLNLDIVLRHRGQTVGDNEVWLEGIQEEIGRLSRMTSDLLSLARADANRDFVTPVDTHLVPILERVARTHTSSAQAKGLALALHIAANAEDGVPLRADPDRLHQLLTILVDNAIKYTDAGHIDITLSSDAKELCIDVTDTGPGISDVHQKHIFDRFFRSDEARTRPEGGTGLGLSIAKLIAESHGGHLKVKSELRVGTTFTVTLPRH